MNRPHRHLPFENRRGSALLIALVMALVLTIVAVSIAYFTSTEDRMSGNDKLQKQGFYAAETGLRVGESVLNGNLGSTTSINTLLNPSLGTPPTNGSGNALDLHDRGYQAVLLKVGAKEYRDIAVSFGGASPGPCSSLATGQTAGTTRDQPCYTLYVRNDQEDRGPAASDKNDTNKVINLISVGYVNLPATSDFPAGRRITKILEEQVTSVDTGTGSGFEKGANEGGTNG